MGYGLEWCPTFHQCCGCVSLRLGLLWIASLGAVWGAMHLYAYSPAGSKSLLQAGVPALLADSCGARLVHGVLGVLLFALHIMLAAATIFINAAIFELYCWALMGINIAVFLIAVLASSIAGFYGCPLLAAGIAFFVAFIVLVSLYFAAIVANYRMTLP